MDNFSILFWHLPYCVWVEVLHISFFLGLHWVRITFDCKRNTSVEKNFKNLVYAPHPRHVVMQATCFLPDVTVRGYSTGRPLTSRPELKNLVECKKFIVVRFFAEFQQPLSSFQSKAWIYCFFRYESCVPSKLSSSRPAGKWEFSIWKRCQLSALKTKAHGRHCDVSLEFRYFDVQKMDSWRVCFVF